MGANQSKPSKGQRRHPSPTHPTTTTSPKPPRTQQPPLLRLRAASSSSSSYDRERSNSSASIDNSMPILVEDDDDWPSIDFRDHHANVLLKNHFSESQLSDDLPSQPPVIVPPSLSSTTSSLSSARTALFSTHSLPSTISSVQSFQSKYDIALPSVPTINNPSAPTIAATSQQQHHFDTEYIAALRHYHGLFPSSSASSSAITRQQQQQQQPDYGTARTLFQKVSVNLREDLNKYPGRRAEIVNIISDAQYHLGEMYITGKGVEKPDSTKAMRFLQSAADNGHMLAQYMIGHYSQHAGDLPRAIDQYRRSALQGYVKAMAALGILLVKHHETFPGLFDEAHNWLQLAAEKDEASAVLQLAYLNEEGLLVKRDLQLSFELYEKYLALCPSTRVANHAELHRLMGLHYREGGADLKTDYKAALRHLEIAAQTGLASAQRSLGFMYQLGLGVTVNVHKAQSFFKLAANQGDVLALGALGNLYRSSKETLPKALECYELAASRGSPPALMSLANLLVELDRPDEAEEALRRLINTQDRMYHTMAFLHLGLLRRDTDLLRSLNHPTADYKLGQMAGSKDEALAHYIRAAKAGHVEAMYQCADILSNHRKDPTSAYDWYTQAASQGHPMAQVCEALYYINGLPPAHTKDYARAEALLRLAVVKKPKEANVHLAIVLKDTHPVEARKRFTSAARMGDTEAMRHLATMLEKNDDEEQALSWLEKASDLKDPRAMVALSAYYEKGRRCDNGEPNIPESLKWLQKAEALGYIRASFNIATLFENQLAWTDAAEKYDWIAAKFPMANQYGWYARLLKHRLVVLHKVGDVSETYQLLQTMIKNPRTPESLIEPYELLGMCCEDGLGIQCDLGKALTWYEMATQITIKTDKPQLDLNQERARCRLASLYFRQGNLEAAFSCLRRLEPHLHRMRSHLPSETITQAREARYLLGHLLLYGPEPNVDEARHWLTEAADQSHPDAVYELGVLALAENDHVEARRWFEQGESMGHAHSKRELALLLLQDDDVNDKHRHETIRCLLEDAIDMGDVAACYELGKLYEINPKGHFPSEHPLAAYDLYVKAGEQGGHRLARISAGEVLFYQHRCEHDAQTWFALEPDHWFSKFRMAMIQGDSDTKRLETLLPLELPEADAHERRWWCKAAEVLGDRAPDNETAIEWYTLAADLTHSNYVPAMLALAALYRQCYNDEVSALEWYRHAANQNDPTGLYEVGLYHREGKAGLEKNAVVAASYLSRAADQDHPDARFQLGETYWQMHDYVKGWNAYTQAADKNGYVPALRTVGFLYDVGVSRIDKFNKRFTLRMDKEMAIRYFCRAAKMDDIESIIMLGQYHERNPIDALGIYQRAAEALPHNNHALLEFVIGRLFNLMANDNTVDHHKEKLHQTAYERFARSIETCTDSHRSIRAHAEMMLTLYHLYDWYPPTHDPVKGFHTLLRLDQEADPDIQVTVKENLARCYENAIGTDKNLPLAIVQWKCLCELGVSHALTTIEEYHKDGLVTDAELQSARRAFHASQAFNGHVEGRPETASSATSTTSSYNN